MAFGKNEADLSVLIQNEHRDTILSGKCSTVCYHLRFFLKGGGAGGRGFPGGAVVENPPANAGTRV